MDDGGATTTLRPSLARRVGFGVLLVVVLGAVPLLIAVAVALDGGPAGAVGALVIVALAGWLLVLGFANVLQRWTVGPDTVEVRRPLLRSRSWPRAGLTLSSTTTPRYSRGIRVGTSRTLHLAWRGPDEEVRTESVDVGLLGADGFTDLVAAIRAPGTGTPSRELRRRIEETRALLAGSPVARSVDERFEVDHAAIARYRRWRWRWRGVGLAAGAVAVLGARATIDDGPGWLGAASFAAAFALGFYLLQSVMLQVVRRPAGPVPTAVRVSEGGVDVEHAGSPTGDRFAWSALSEVEVSADLAGEAVLRLVPSTGGDATAYSLTGRVGDDVRDAVLPGHLDLVDALHTAGARHGVAVVEIQR